MKKVLILLLFCLFMRENIAFSAQFVYFEGALQNETTQKTAEMLKSCLDEVNFEKISDYRERMDKFHEVLNQCSLVLQIESQHFAISNLKYSKSNKYVRGTINSIDPGKGEAKFNVILEFK